MNSIVLYPNEVASSGAARVTGERADHLLNAHRISEGLSVRGAILNKGRVRLAIKNPSVEASA